MGNIFNSEAPLMQGLSKIADLIALNLLTVLLSLPIVTAGAAITALYDATWRIIQDEGAIYRSYFRAFKTNFKQATAIWLLVVLSGALLTFCVLFYVTNSLLPMVAASALLLLLWAVIVAWVFPLQSRFENKVKVTLKNALLCGLGYLPRSLAMVVLILLPWVVLLFATQTWLELSFIWVAGWQSITAYVSMMLLRKPFRKLMGEEEQPQ